MPERLLWWSITGLVLFRTTLVGWWPYPVHMQSPGETALILNQAMFILDGEWLGPYGEPTLAMSPIASIWVASMHFAGIPLLLSLHALYVGVCIICMVASRRLTDSRGFQLLIFAILLFSPFSYGYESVVTSFREMLGQSLVLGVLGTLTIVFLDLIERGKTSAGYSVLLGIFVALLWNSDSEPLWLFVYLVWALLLSLYYVSRGKNAVAGSLLSGLLPAVAIPAVVLLLATGAISWKNLDAYDVFSVSETSAPEFKSALEGIMSIESGAWGPHTAIPPDVVEKLRSLPSGSELASSLGVVPENSPVHFTTVTDALRSSVRDAGYYEAGGGAVMAYYRRLGQEIDVACESGDFECRNSLAGLLPRWRSGDAARLIDSFSDMVSRAMDIPALGSAEEVFSVGDPVSILGVSRLVNSPVKVDEHLEYFLPEFYQRTKKNKTRYLEKLVDFYRLVVPFAFWAAVLGLIWRLFIAIRDRQLSLLDKVFFGLSGSMLVQLVLIAHANFISHVDTTRYFYLVYPVLYLFTSLGLLALLRNVLNGQRPARS